MHTAGDRRNRRTRHAIAIGAICILVALAYANALPNEFVFDDVIIVRNNPLLRHVRHLPTLFTTHYWEGAAVGGNEYSRALYRPLVLASYTANFLVTGAASWPFHLTNVLIHLGAVIALYGLACRLRLEWPGALAAALVFAVHPLNTEAVTGIVGRAELMMALGVLLALDWDLGKNPVEEAGTKLSWASLAAFAFALLSKEQAIMLPAIVLIADGMRPHRDRLPIRRLLWNARLRYLGYVLVAAAYLVVRFAVLGLRLPPAASFENPLGWMELPLRLINTIKIDGLYLWLALWPADLSADYSYNAIDMSATVLDPAVWGSALVWGALLVLGVVAFVKRWRPLAIGLAATLLFFLPVSNLIFQIGTIMGERLFYLPLAGLCLALGTGWDFAFEGLGRGSLRPWRRVIALGAAMLALIPLAARTVARNRDWQDNRTLFASTLRVYPNNAKGHLQMARVYLADEEAEKALAAIEKALDIAPFYRHFSHFAEVHGRVLTAMGRHAEAVAVITAALERGRADDPEAYRVLSKAHEGSGSIALAAAARARAIEIARRIPRTSTRALMPDHNHLARLQTLQGKTAEGRRTLAAALELVREDRDLPEGVRIGMTAELLGNIALIDALEGHYAAAEEKYLKVLELLESPLVEEQVAATRASRLRDYARLLRRMGRAQDAAAIEREAASIESTAAAR